MRERDRRDSERSSTTGNEGATGGGQGEASSAGDVASESSLPDIQVSHYNFKFFLGTCCRNLFNSHRFQIWKIHSLDRNS
jgi:hypothetical protein